MFIQTETTPNPATLKFIPGETVVESGARNFTDKNSCAASPLAESLFQIKGVEAVYLGGDFISVTKAENLKWDSIKTEILTTIMEHFVAKRPVILDDGNTKIKDSSNETDDEVVKQIKEIIETRVRPAVAQDGGDIIFHSFEDGIVRLELHGACSGCPSSTITLKNGIENMLKHYVPEVESVEQI